MEPIKKYIVQYAFIESTQMNDAFSTEIAEHANAYALLHSWHPSIGTIRVIERLETVKSVRNL
jgi:hypothetical protein